MGLEEYIKKRDFSTTPEPKGNVQSLGQYRFVVQRHQASRLHYDLRLEIDGVLKSWAIPKGPSMNPEDKRLSIQTEDHPIKYLSFHGTIPKGNYGAGVMDIWDSGTFQVYSENQGNVSAQLKKGNLKLEFFGKKLKGKFALIHTKKGNKNNHWLLIKKNDQHAQHLKYDAENLTAFTNKQKHTEPKVLQLNPETIISPMLCTNGKQIFNDSQWIFELKWDGYRMLSHVIEGEVSMYSRNGKNFNHKFELLKNELQTIPHDVILDGEVVIVDEEGVSHFQKLQNYHPETTKGVLRYYVFDLLFLNGYDTHTLPLTERKSLLPEVIEGLEHVLYCDHIETLGKSFYNKAVEKGMEGVIAKKAKSVYVPGYRSEDWLKIKATNSIESIICGYTDSEGAIFGSLILGVHRQGQLTYIGNCGTGFSATEQRELLSLFKTVEKCPFKQSPNLKGRNPNWIRPEFICEVKFSEWTKNGLLRHPSYKGLREDKTLSEIKIPKQKKVSSAKVSSSLGTALNVNGFQVPITHPEKIYWPDSGLRKYDLIDYYIKISDTILPYLIDRPHSLHRHPNGIASKGFFQKDHENVPQWAKTVSIYSKSSKKDINYLVCNNEAALLYMANLGCIEMNPWNSRTQYLNRPDYTVIDLDPSEKNTFGHVIETAQATKEVLDDANITGYCKTSGSSGLHIYIPLNAKYSYHEARDFTKLLCYYIEEKLPKLTSTKRAIKDRKGKVYLDYLQNRRGQTLASAYCVRPKSLAPVSCPISWDELNSNLKITDFNIHTVPNRIKKRGDIFKSIMQETIDMEKALFNLENLR